MCVKLGKNCLLCKRTMLFFIYSDISFLSTVPQSSSILQIAAAQYTNRISCSLPSIDALKLPSSRCTAATPSTMALRFSRLKSSPSVMSMEMPVYVIAKWPHLYFSEPHVFGSLFRMFIVDEPWKPLHDFDTSPLPSALSSPSPTFETIWKR